MDGCELPSYVYEAGLDPGRKTKTFAHVAFGQRTPPTPKVLSLELAGTRPDRAR